MIAEKKIIQVDINKCSRCGQGHTGIDFIPLSADIGAYTHWASCPVNGEPMLLSYAADEIALITKAALAKQGLNAASLSYIIDNWQSPYDPGTISTFLMLANHIDDSGVKIAAVDLFTKMLDQVGFWKMIDKVVNKDKTPTPELLLPGA